MDTTTHIDLRCVAAASGGTRLVELGASGLLRARALPPRDGVARVALVQTAASLLAGDRIELRIHAGPRCRLEVVEVAGLVAHDVRGGPTAAIDVLVTAGTGARVHWGAQPLVLAAGSRLERTTRVRLEAGAALLWRDTVVFGRAGEAGGVLRSALDVRRAGRDLVAETLDTADVEAARSAVVLGDAKVLDTLALFGARADDAAALQLAGPGSVRPVCAASVAAAARELDSAQDWWRRTVMEEDRDHAAGNADAGLALIAR